MAASAAALNPFRRVEREQIALAVVLFALAVVAWLVTDDRMGGMPSGPTTDLGGLGFYTTVWVVMMAAMMFPSVWPVVGMYERIRSQRTEAPRAGTALVVAGYLLSWTIWGLAAFGLIHAARALFGDFLPWDGAGRWVAAGVVLAAAAYQLTPLKNACLTRCRGPLMFVIENWRPGAIGALRMGVVHGAWCVGCCWALMAALFALGVMSLGWMAAIAALIAIEKLLPSRTLANYSVAFILAVVGFGLVVHPSSVPGVEANGGGGPGGSMQMQMDGH
jgi:predicted metal-binding membrane protein